MDNQTNDEPQHALISPEEVNSESINETAIMNVVSEDDKEDTVSEGSEELPNQLESKEIEKELDISEDTVIAQTETEVQFHEMDSPMEPSITQNARDTVVETVNNKTEQFVDLTEFNTIVKSLKDLHQESLITSQDVSTKLDTVVNDTDVIIKQVNNLSTNYVLLSTEIESLVSGSSTKSILSKSFLVFSSLILVLLVAFQIYMFFLLNNVQQLQNTEGAKVLQNITSLNKKNG